MVLKLIGPISLFRFFNTTMSFKSFAIFNLFDVFLNKKLKQDF